jgi:hypothetical protein
MYPLDSLHIGYLNHNKEEELISFTSRFKNQSYLNVEEEISDDAKQNGPRQNNNEASKYPVSYKYKEYFLNDTII